MNSSSFTKLLILIPMVALIAITTTHVAAAATPSCKGKAPKNRGYITSASNLLNKAVGDSAKSTGGSTVTDSNKLVRVKFSCDKSSDSNSCSACLGIAVTSLNVCLTRASASGSIDEKSSGGCSVSYGRK